MLKTEGQKHYVNHKVLGAQIYDRQRLRSIYTEKIVFLLWLIMIVKLWKEYCALSLHIPSLLAREHALHLSANRLFKTYCCWMQFSQPQ